MFAKEKNNTNSFLNTNSAEWEFKWEKKHILLTGVIVVCAILLFKPEWLQWLTNAPINLGLLVGGLNALNYLITLTK